MFTGIPKEKSFWNGDFKVTVEYTNGPQKWKETYNITSAEDLNNRIDRRLEELNKLEAFADTLVLGTWTKPVKEVPVADPVQEALNAVYQAKSEFDMKLITQAEYDAVVLAYKTLANGK